RYLPVFHRIAHADPATLDFVASVRSGRVVAATPSVASKPGMVPGFLRLATALRAASLLASVGGARQGFFPNRKGNRAQSGTRQSRTSLGIPPEQSRHLARIAFRTGVGSKPMACNLAFSSMLASWFSRPFMLRRLFARDRRRTRSAQAFPRRVGHAI